MRVWRGRHRRGRRRGGGHCLDVWGRSAAARSTSLARCGQGPGHHLHDGVYLPGFRDPSDLLSCWASRRSTEAPLDMATQDHDSRCGLFIAFRSEAFFARWMVGPRCLTTSDGEVDCNQRHNSDVCDDCGDNALRATRAVGTVMTWRTRARLFGSVKWSSANSHIRPPALRNCERSELKLIQ